MTVLDKAFDNLYFEGPEKNLKIYFRKNENPSLRAISKKQWSIFLKYAGARILQPLEAEDFTSFLLSESSLFITDTKIQIKTCGTTPLLRILEPLCEYLKDFNPKYEPSMITYTRTGYGKPEEQETPHKTFASESDFVDKLFGKKGKRFVFSEASYHFYFLELIDYAKLDDREKLTRLENLEYMEVLLTELRNGEKMGMFYEKEYTKYTYLKEQDPLVKTTKDPFYMSPSYSRKIGQEMTKRSKISEIFSGGCEEMYESWGFAGCGYSMNGIVPKGRNVEDGYYTIHITPQLEFSYASFEVTTRRKNVQEYTDISRIVGSLFGQAGSRIIIVCQRKGYECQIKAEKFDELKKQKDWEVCQDCVLKVFKFSDF